MHDVVVVGRFCETPSWTQKASAADALQFWGTWSRHYAAKMSLHNVFVEAVEAALSAANQI